MVVNSRVKSAISVAGHHRDRIVSYICRHQVLMTIFIKVGDKKRFDVVVGTDLY